MVEPKGRIYLQFGGQFALQKDITDLNSVRRKTGFPSSLSKFLAGIHVTKDMLLKEN